MAATLDPSKLALLIGSLLAVSGCDLLSLNDFVGRTGQEPLSSRQYIGASLPDKTLALTFDDGPGDRTAELADYLVGENVPAAFFVNGKNDALHPQIVIYLWYRGHLVANHTQNHLDLTKLSPERIIEEVALTDAIIRPFAVNYEYLLRPPYGAWNSYVANVLANSPMKKYVGSIFWDIGGVSANGYAADWSCWSSGLTPTDCANGYMAEIAARRRGIVLMHDSHRQTVDMVKILVPMLKAQGYKFVRIDAVPSIHTALGLDTPFIPIDGATAHDAGANDAGNMGVSPRG